MPRAGAVPQGGWVLAGVCRLGLKGSGAVDRRLERWSAGDWRLAGRAAVLAQIGCAASKTRRRPRAQLLLLPSAVPRSIKMSAPRTNVRPTNTQLA